MTLTVVIPTLNEEADLPRCLNSVSFADEILVIDSGSTDRTLEIARKYQAQIIKHPFRDFASQRQEADRYAHGDWILSIDADVEIPLSLAQEIQAILPNTNCTAFKIGRENIIWGKTIWHTDWNPNDDCHIRLYRRGSGKWQSQVHEIYQVSGKIGYLKNHLIHHNYQSVSEFIDKSNRYSTLEAQKRFQSDVRFSWLKFYSEPLKDFSKRFFYKLGFLDGWHGFFLSLLQAMYFLMVNIKLYQLEKR